MRADVVTIKRFPARPWHEECRRREQQQTGGTRPWHAAARPTHEHFLRDEISRDKTHINEQRDLVRSFPTLPPRRAAEGHDTGGGEHHEQRDVPCGKAQRHTSGELVAAELKPSFYALGNSHARHGRARNAFDPGRFQIESRRGVPSEAVPFL